MSGQTPPPNSGGPPRWRTPPTSSPGYNYTPPNNNLPYASLVGSYQPRAPMTPQQQDQGLETPDLGSPEYGRQALSPAVYTFQHRPYFPRYEHSLPQQLASRSIGMTTTLPPYSPPRTDAVPLPESIHRVINRPIPNRHRSRFEDASMSPIAQPQFGSDSGTPLQLSHHMPGIGTPEWGSPSQFPSPQFDRSPPHAGSPCNVAQNTGSPQFSPPNQPAQNVTPPTPQPGAVWEPSAGTSVMSHRAQTQRGEKRSRDPQALSPLDGQSAKHAKPVGRCDTPEYRRNLNAEGQISPTAVKRAADRLPNFHNALSDEPVSNALRGVDPLWFTQRLPMLNAPVSEFSLEVSRRHREVHNALREEGNTRELDYDEIARYFRIQAHRALEDAGTQRLHPVGNKSQMRYLAAESYRFNHAQGIPTQPFSLSREFRDECFQCKAAVNQINAFYMKCGHVYCMPCVIGFHKETPILKCACGYAHGASFEFLLLFGLYLDGVRQDQPIIEWNPSEPDLMYYAWRQLQYFNADITQTAPEEGVGYDIYYSTQQ